MDYAYDGLSNRIKQTVGVNVTQYLLDLQPGLAVVLADTQDANTTRYVHGPTGIHAHKDSANHWEWMMQDGLGSVRGVVDNNVAVLESRLYDPYGVPFGATGTNQTSYGFTGEPTDSNGLVHLRARYYAPNLGVLPSLDPLEGATCTPMSLNGYSWVEGNTTNAVDPSGMIGEDPSEWDKCDDDGFFTPTPSLTRLYNIITDETVEYYSGTQLNCLKQAVQNEVGTVGSGIDEQAEWVTWAVLNRYAVTRELDYRLNPNGGGSCGSNGRYNRCTVGCSSSVQVDSRISSVIETTLNNFRYRSLSSDPTHGAAGWRQGPNLPPLTAEQAEACGQIENSQGQLACYTSAYRQNWPQYGVSPCGDYHCRERSQSFPNRTVCPNCGCGGVNYVETVDAFYDRIETRQNGYNRFYGNRRRSTGFNVTRAEAGSVLSGCIDRIYVTTVNPCEAGSDGDNICWITGNSEFRR